MTDAVDIEARERVSKLEARVDDLDKRVGDMGAVAVAVGVLTERLDHVGKSVEFVHADLKSEVDFRNQREEQYRRDRREFRIALWTAVAVITGAVIGAVALFIVG